MIAKNLHFPDATREGRFIENSPNLGSIIYIASEELMQHLQGNVCCKPARKLQE
jgi:hypothetical protein